MIMSGSDLRHAGCLGLGWVSSVIIFLACAVVAYYVWAKIYITKSLQRADEVELTQTLRRWMEEGRPEGEALTEFMQGRRQDLVVSNRTFTVRGTNYKTQFAVTTPKSQRLGTLFITTNEALIWCSPSGQLKLSKE
jgi:hypothetical protein